MFFQPQTNFDWSRDSVGSSESDTALRLWAALQVEPLRSPRTCHQKIILPSFWACVLASSRDVFQEIFSVSRSTSFWTSLPSSARPRVGTVDLTPFLSFPA